MLIAQRPTLTEEVVEEDRRSRFVIEPLEPGFGYTLGILAIDVAAGAIFAFTPYLRFLFILLGFAWLAYAKSLLYLRAFQRVSGDPNTPREKPDYSLPSASIQ